MFDIDSDILKSITQYDSLPAEVESRIVSRIRESHNSAEVIIENALYAKLALSGGGVARQVQLRNGIADIVTPTHLYEVKSCLTRKSVYKAVGQLLVYAQELSNRTLVIIGRSGDGLALRAAVQRLGIEMKIWYD